jgi:hypothetical protein
VNCVAFSAGSDNPFSFQYAAPSSISKGEQKGLIAVTAVSLRDVTTALDGAGASHASKRQIVRATLAVGHGSQGVAEDKASRSPTPA